MRIGLVKNILLSSFKNAFFFQALYLPSKGKYMSSPHLVNGDALIRQRITGIWGTEERRDSETQCGFSSCSHFRCTGWDTKARGKLGFSPFLDAFSSPGYFWSQCISGKTSTNGTKASSLPTNSGLYWSSQVWPTHNQLQPLGRQSKSVLSNLTLSPPLHAINYTAEMTEDIHFLWKELWKGVTQAEFESYV